MLLITTFFFIAHPSGNRSIHVDVRDSHVFHSVPAHCLLVVGLLYAVDLYLYLQTLRQEPVILKGVLIAVILLDAIQLPGWR